MVIYKKETKPIVLIDLISHFENYFEWSVSASWKLHKVTIRPANIAYIAPHTLSRVQASREDCVSD